MTMKTFLTCLPILLLTACEEIDKLLTFSINDRTTIHIEATPSPLTLPVVIATPDVTSDSQQQYANNNTHASLVKDVKLEQLKLTITDPPARTFSFLKTIRIFISSDASNEIELASAENIAPDISTLELITTKEKLDAYVKASAYNLRTEVTTDETLTEGVDIQVDLKFLVTADAY